MLFGEKMAVVRQAEGLTQAELAEKSGVSAEVISKLEDGGYRPEQDQMEQLEKALHWNWYDEKGELLSGRIFDEEHMSAFLKEKFASGRFPEAQKALPYAGEQHRSTKPRKGPGNVPYISHPLTLTCHALAMGLEDDILLAALLLHDVTEDCGIPPAEMPVCEEVQEIVALVSKPEKKDYNAKKYFDAIAENPRACMVKCIDRCNNLSTMAVAFSREKMIEYIEETETWYPRLLKIIKGQPAYSNAAWLLSYQIGCTLQTVKSFL